MTAKLQIENISEDENTFTVQLTLDKDYIIKIANKTMTKGADISFNKKTDSLLISNLNPKVISSQHEMGCQCQTCHITKLNQMMGWKNYP